MSLKCSNSLFQSPSPPSFPRNLAIQKRSRIIIIIKKTFQIGEYRVWRRRRLKTTFVVRNQLLGLEDSLFGNFLLDVSDSSHLLLFPITTTIAAATTTTPAGVNLITPALGFASALVAAALYLSRFRFRFKFRLINLLLRSLIGNNSDSEKEEDNIGEEWILFTSPTPFNRFVMLRCPSISSCCCCCCSGDQFLLENSKKLVVKGKARDDDDDDDREEEENKLLLLLEYQRVCISSGDDGGVISLDWPSNLDLAAEEDQGLDTTLLLIPGTAQGSLDHNIRSLVSQSLKRGYFPVVMNPRGCADSPLTTPRLFTAADSDDICTAVHFIKKARPWTTLMGVGWGYGANMLTKYLAEVGEKTPLIAATCINNPFDLEEATRSSPHNRALDRKLTGGFIDILRSNKELFRNRAKGFDVEKALLAKSVRDFEKEISMVSYGFDAIEDFYAKSSTQGLIGNIKIPVLFIQSDDATVPVFSIPLSLIAENPFTSLLLCSCSPTSVIATARFAITWCQHLTLEWLAAVELGLLKGRHPLLKDVDVTISPSHGLTMVERRASDKSVRLDLTQPIASDRYSVNPSTGLPEESHTADTSRSRTQDLVKIFEADDENKKGILQRSSSEGGAGPVDSERGQVLQTAQVVMNMLDEIMPDTLVEEQKKKVLVAVGKGETVMKALQDAVPEDVCDKLTTAVSGIFQNQGMNLKFDGLQNIGQIPNVASGLKSKIQEKFGGLSSVEGGYEDVRSTYRTEIINELADDSTNSQRSTDKFSGVQESEFQASEDPQKTIDSGPSQPAMSQGGDIPGPIKKGTNELGNNYENADLSRQKVAQHSEYDENGSETSVEPDLSSRYERVDSSEDVNVDQHQVDQDGGMAKVDIKEEDNYQQNDEKNSNSISDPNKTNVSTKTEEALPHPVSSSEAQQMEREGSTRQKREENNMCPVLNQSSSDPPSFSVSQALDALTVIDDSTQVAVNSVFGVIEDMITQLEVEKDKEVEVGGRKEVEDGRTGSVSENHHIDSDDNLEKNEANKNELSILFNKLDDLPSYTRMDLPNEARTGWLEEKPGRNPISLDGNSSNSYRGDDTARFVNKNGEMEHFLNRELLVDNLDKVRNLDNILLYMATNPYQDSVYKEYLQRYLLSKMPNTESLDLTTAVFLDYIPEEGQWKLLEQAGNNRDSTSDDVTHEDDEGDFKVRSHLKDNYTDTVFEPSYVILDTVKQQEPVREFETVDKVNQKVEVGDNTSKEFMSFVYDILLDSLKLEVGRRLSAVDMKEMEPNLVREMEQVAKAVSHTIVHSKENILFLEGKEHNSGKVGTLHAEDIIKAISFSVQDSIYLKSVLPVGVIIGSGLAALRKFFIVAAVNANSQSEALTVDILNNSEKRSHIQLSETETDVMHSNKLDQKYCLDSPENRNGDIPASRSLKNDAVMVGAVTASLGATALLVHQQDSYHGDETFGSLSESFEEKRSHQKEPQKLEEGMSEKNQHNIATSLAEKAMSVAGPVVPKKEDGEVDQERLVAMLAELGQKGGMLKVVGKIALLWGGLRGAMSLTDRLILFLRIAERPLFQRILGFVCMVLVLWSPVVVPLLPTLVQSWTTNNSSKIAELACIIGLYASIMILVMLWGKRIRGYHNPLEQYGLDFTSLPKVQDFLKGLIGGTMLVLSIHYVNALLGCVRLSWPSSLPSSSSDALTWFKVYGKMLMLVGQGIVTATGVAFVEELLFRSWLPTEIATDLGYHRGIIISGLAFSLSQRSPWAIPGLWLVSLGLAGARQRSHGSLSVPIGLRAGIMASSFVLQVGDFLTYQPNFPIWVTGTHPFQPFSGIVGLVFSLLWAIVLYPRQPLHEKKPMTIRQ